MSTAACSFPLLGGSLLWALGVSGLVLTSLFNTDRCRALPRTTTPMAQSKPPKSQPSSNPTANEQKLKPRHLSSDTKHSSRHSFHIYVWCLDSAVGRLYVGLLLLLCKFIELVVFVALLAPHCLHMLSASAYLLQLDCLFPWFLGGAGLIPPSPCRTTCVQSCMEPRFFRSSNV